MHKKSYFCEVAIGETFGLNGNVWVKRSSRTAAGIWPACLPAWAYIGKREVITSPKAIEGFA